MVEPATLRAAGPDSCYAQIDGGLGGSRAGRKGVLGGGWGWGEAAAKDGKRPVEA